MENTLKNTEIYGNIRKEKVVILWVVVLIYVMNYTSYKYSVRHKI
jgi:hypothetical protein